jgi:hypothetical protein
MQALVDVKNCTIVLGGAIFPKMPTNKKLEAQDVMYVIVTNIEKVISHYS